VKQILVTGSLAFDYIMDFPGNFTDHINPEFAHKINVSFLINKLKKERGGTAGNIAYTLALLNTSSSILGTVGEDFEQYSNFLSQKKINISNIKVIKNEFSAQAYIMTDKKHDQIIAFYPGAMNYSHTLTPRVKKIKPDFLLITPSDSKGMIDLVIQCKKLHIPYMYDPSHRITVLSDEEILQGISGAKIFVGNDYEYEMIKKRLKFLDKDFLKHAEIVIITKGAEGSEIYTKDQHISIPTIQTKEVLDPTGAGDAYRAGFMAGYTRGFTLKTCGQMGTVAATYTIEKYGTQNHTFTISQFKTRYRKAFKEVIEL